MSDKAIDNACDLGHLSKDEASYAKRNFQARRDREQEEACKSTLPVPSLKSGESLTLAKFQEFAKVSLPGPSGTGQAADAIDLGSLTAEHWGKVLWQCKSLQGRIFSKLGSSASEDIPSAAKTVFRLKNTTPFPTLVTAADRSSFIHSDAVLSEKFSQISVVSGTDAAAQVASPFVSGSFEFKQITEEQTAEKGSTVTLVATFLYPVVRLDLSEVDGDSPSSVVEVNPEFEEDVTKWLGQNKPDILGKIRSEYGDVVAMHQLIGVAAYTTDTETMNEKQSLESLKRGFAGKVQTAAPIAGVSVAAGGGGGYQRQDANEQGNRDQRKTYQFTALAGNVADHTNPSTVAQFRNNPNSWRAIHLQDLRPTTDFLTKATREKLAEAEAKRKAEAEAEAKRKAVKHVKQAFPDVKTTADLDRIIPGNEKAGWTPLLMCAYKGDVELVGHCLAAGCYVDIQTAAGATPLFVAAQEGHVPVVDRLLAAKCNMNKPANTGTTPLLQAAQNGHLGVVERLVAASANVNTPKTDGSAMTPLAIAASQGHVEVVRALRNAGADKTAVTKYGTALKNAQDDVKDKAKLKQLKDLLR